MLKGIPTKRNAIIIATAVTVVWSTSWIFIKIGLREIPALPFAGLRYIMAFLFLLPWMLKKSTLQATRELRKKDWVMLAILGLLTYPLNQGGLFLAVTYLPNTTVNLISNLGPVFIALLGWLWLNETMNRWQFLGMGTILAGALVFFLPISWGTISGLGLLFSFIALFANVFGSILTRKMLRNAAFPVLLVTGIPMGIGSILVAGGAAVWEWIPQISLKVWGILIFLSLINTTIAFTVWNVAQQRLTAFEANVIANTMLVQVALLSWFFLGEVITWKMVAGMALVMGGAVLVNFRGRE